MGGVRLQEMSALIMDVFAYGRCPLTEGVHFREVSGDGGLTVLIMFKHFSNNDPSICTCALHDSGT